MSSTREIKVSGRMVLVTLILFFSVIAGVNALMATLAIRTFGGLEADNAYRAGLEFARELRAARDQQARNLKVEVATKRLPDGSTDFRLSVENLEPAAVAGLRAVLELRHPADRRHDHRVELRRINAGEFGGQSFVEPGQWNVRISLDRENERIFRSVNRMTLQ